MARKEETSVVLIDPHGDLADDIFKLRISKEIKDRLIYINPYLSKNYTATINPFQTYDKSEENIDLTTRELVILFKELIDTDYSLQMEAIGNPCVATLLRTDFGTLSEFQRFMDDTKNHDLVELGKKSPNPSHREFFHQAFHKKEYARTKQAIYTRIQSLLNHTVFYQLMNAKSTVDLRHAVDHGKIIIFNLSQGKMGVDMASVYGKFIIAQLTGIAMKRAYKPPHLRMPTFLMIDEFHNFVTESSEKVLAETRKYGLHLIVCQPITLSDIKSQAQRRDAV